ncbi:MAG: NAD+ synthase [Candidatus Nanohaloarchaeota archaeon QJJ-7]|nr:NAD+ synthase [Candidatus Nanohaloarchaeota archaeon QJJ-7]
MVDIPESRKRIEEFLADYLHQSGASGYIVGVSGGLDSAVTLKLAVEAVGPGRVEGLIMPGQPSHRENIQDAKELCQELGVEFHELGIEETVDQFSSEVPFEPERETEGNLRVRIRMVLLYMFANEKSSLVLGTSNRTETLLGYFTKYGDEAADVRAISELYKTEVKELADELGLPRKFVEKEPTAGMWEGQTDEGELGATYEEIDKILKRYIDEGKDVSGIVEEVGIEKEKVECVVELHESSSHKRGTVPSPEIR